MNRKEAKKKMANELGIEEKDLKARGFIYVYGYTNKGEEKYKLDVDKVVEDLCNNYNFISTYGEKLDNVWVYRDGIFEKDGRKFIETTTESLLGSWSKNNSIKEIIGKIKRKTSLKNDWEDPPTNLICLENGVFDIDKKKLLKHSPEYKFKTKIPVKYDEKAECPIFKKYLEETLTVKGIEILQEWFGYTLYRDHPIKKCLILYGDSDTGKTVVVNVLTGFFGQKNTIGLDLQTIAAKDKFALSHLYQKHLNIYDDLSKADLKDGGGLKVATGGGSITAEYKFGDTFTFRPYAKNIFACNQIPDIKDKNDFTFFGRFVILIFQNVVDEKRKDPNLFLKILSSEKSGILNWALVGLYRISKNNSFSYSKTAEEIKTLMQSSANPLRKFVDEVLEREENSILIKPVFYEVYKEWCEKNKVENETKTALTQQLDRFAKGIRSDRKSIKVGEKYKTERVFMNYKIKDKESYDTYDTIKNSIYAIQHEKILYKGEKKPSNPSQRGLGTYDTISKKEQKEKKTIDFSELDGAFT